MYNGQEDPHSHCWIYFITIFGEAYFMDYGMMINEGLYFKCRLLDLSFVPAYFQSLKFLVDAYNRVSEITVWKEINDSPFFENSDFHEPTEYFNYDT